MPKVGELYKLKVFTEEIPYIVVIVECNKDEIIIEPCHIDHKEPIKFSKEKFSSLYEFIVMALQVNLYAINCGIGKTRVFWELQNGNKLKRVANEFWPSYNPARL